LDYFAFTPGWRNENTKKEFLFESDFETKLGTFGVLPNAIPPFVLGVVTFDNWLMHRAIKLRNVFVVESVITNSVVVFMTRF
jgi:hypothetical protein